MDKERQDQTSMPKRYPYLVEFDVLAAWQRMHPKASCPPFLVSPENEQIRRHVDICLHTMTLIEVEASCRERFGKRPGLTRCSIHAYCRDFWLKEFPRGKARGAARHRRGTIRALEADPAIVPHMRKLARFGRARLIWMLLCREMGCDGAPALEQITRYVRRVNGGHAGRGARPSAIEQNASLIKRIGELMRWRSPRLIHELIAHDFGKAAPIKPDTTADYLRQIGLGKG